MTIFDLLFIAVFLTTACTVAVAAVAALRGRTPVALKYVKRLALGLALYLAIVAAVGLTSPQQTVAVGEPQCFDDWCIAVGSYRHATSGESATYTVDLILSSRARGKPQREAGVAVHVADAGGRRYEAEFAAQWVPLDTVLQPGASAVAVRTFRLPAAATGATLVVTHGAFPSIMIVGDPGSLFHKRPVVRLD